MFHNTVFALTTLGLTAISPFSAVLADEAPIADANKVYVESAFETKCEGDDTNKCVWLKAINETFQGQTCEVTVEYLGGDICDGATLRRATIGGVKIDAKTNQVSTRRVVPAEMPIKICSVSNAVVKSCEDDGLWEFTYYPNDLDYKDYKDYGEKQGWMIPEIFANDPENRNRRPLFRADNMYMAHGGYWSKETLEIKPSEHATTFPVFSTEIPVSMEILSHETVKLLQKEQVKLRLQTEIHYGYSKDNFAGLMLKVYEVSCQIGGEHHDLYLFGENINAASKGVLQDDIKGFSVEKCESGVRFEGRYIGRYYAEEGRKVDFSTNFRKFSWHLSEMTTHE